MPLFCVECADGLSFPDALQRIRPYVQLPFVVFDIAIIFYEEDRPHLDLLFRSLMNKEVNSLWLMSIWY